METYFLEDNNIIEFYARVAKEYELYVPTRAPSSLKVKCEHSFILPAQDYLLKKFKDIDKKEIVFNGYRPIEPARSFFTRPKEEICEYFGRNENPPAEKPAAICGLKNCDLFSLKIQDFIFLGGDEPDRFYKARRENALIIAGDCPAFKESCFCRAFDIDPFVTEGFDFNLAPITGGYIIDVASDKARKLMPSLKSLLSSASSSQIGARELNRESVVKHLDEHLSYHKIPKKETLQKIVLGGYNSQVWTDEMMTCVECGGCIFMCDTCHCFLLYDEPNSKRKRVWDGCLYKNFMKVAGGANPLRMRYMRLRNRYLKKFDFFISNIGFQACCGCGRCIDVCPGRIDIRRILRRLHEEHKGAQNVPAH